MDQGSHFIHIVYFYMNEGASAEVLASGCKRLLSGIEGVLRLEAGYPAGTPRPVVDNSYGVMLYVEFLNKDAHDVYQTHPAHLEFIKQYSSYWSRVQIYDTLTTP